jgi:signal transduction histidine kinase
MTPRLEYGAAVAALFALGANVIGTILLLMLNPRSRGLRWYAGFNAVVCIWLLAQGLLMLGIQSKILSTIYYPVVSAMPVLFITAALADRQARNRTLFAILAVGVLAFWFVQLAPYWLQMAWQIAGWGGGATIFMIAQSRTDARSAQPAPRSRKVLELVLMIFVPLGVIGSIYLGAGFVLYTLPLITVTVLILLFIGVVHHQFYDVEVRAARSGELASRAAEQERLAVLGLLAASLAHEVRNPLTGMRSLTQQLAEDNVDDVRRKRYTGVILDEINRLERIVSNLLETSRRSRPVAVTEPTPLNDLFSDLQLLVEGRALREGVRLRCAANGLSAYAGREPLAQALLNLLLNAVAHSPPGSTVDLCAEETSGGTRVFVRDQGAGVPVGEREQIFQPFRSDSGTGLGLAVVRRLSRELGWTVNVATAPGGGAEFSLIVPAAESRRPQTVRA